MITWTKNVYERNNVHYQEGVCLSTDEKPTNGIDNGCVLFEIDTGDVYFFNKETNSWVLL